MTIPPEPPRDVVSRHRLVPRDNVLDRPREDVTVMRESSGEWRPVVEDVFGEVFGELELGLEGAGSGPEVEDLELLFGE